MNINYFFYPFVFLLIGLGVARIYYHFKFKREPERTEFDKALWQLRFSSIGFGIIFYVFTFFAMFGGGYQSQIYLDDPQEKIIKQLVENQQKTEDELRDLRNLFYLTLFMSGGYAFSIVTFIGKIQKLRNDELMKNDAD